MVPISSQYEKLESIRNKIIEKGKPCRGIILGEYAGKKAAYLLQNMFPITEKYIDHIHRNVRNIVKTIVLEYNYRMNTKDSGIG